MTALLIMSLSFQCMLRSMTYASSIHFEPGWKMIQSRPTRPQQLKLFLKELLKEDPKKIDSRLLALSWMESRLRPFVKRGDRGKACGTYQIHARYSYPMFRRKRGFVDWDEKKEIRHINQECRDLESIKYSISTMEQYLEKMDERGLHPCHHNSGFYGTCNDWYKQRLDYWTTYFDVANFICNENKVLDIMAMIRTGNPIPTAPAPMLQGYLDAMSGKEATSEDTVYKSGYDLALLVKEGKAQAPVWASETSPS